MYADAFTLAALVDEFLDTLVGGRIQDVLDIDSTGLGLEIYAQHRRQYLYLSADKQMPRVHRVPDKLRRGVPQPTQMGLLFRRVIEGGRLEHVHQPPYERIIQFDIEHPEGNFTIVVEPMERRSNLLLLKDGIILDCVWRVGPDENRYRLSLPNHEYKLPPPMTDRLDPATVTQAHLEAILSASTDPKQKTAALLTSRILGISPLVGKEIVYRASGTITQKVSEAQPEALLKALNDVVQPLIKHEWQPGIAEDATGVQAYSVYPLTHLAGWHPVESVSEAMVAYYGAAVGPDAYNEMKKVVQVDLDEARKKFSAKLASLESGLKDRNEMDFLQHSGELILAYQYTLKKDQTEMRAQYDPDEPELVIKLDPKLTPVKNAQRYFDRYNRAKRAQTGVPQLVSDTRWELAYIAQLENDLRLASSYPEIDEVIQALRTRGLTSGPKTLARRVGGSGQSAPLRLTKDGFVIWVGRNSRQNEQVTFKLGNGQDLWLHARDVPGAHVVIRNDGRRMAESLIESAAAIAAYYSASRQETRVIVDVTRCKYVKKIKGAAPGMVTYRNEETLTVTPHSEDTL